MIKKYLNHLLKTAEYNYLSNIEKHLISKKLKVNRFLDIGCYTGENTLMIAKSVKARHIYGMDFNREALRVAKKKGVKTVYQDISQPKWKKTRRKYDFIYSNQTIEHLYSVDEYIKNIRSLLKNGGYALISTENLGSWHNAISLLFGYQPFSLTNMSTKKWTIGNPFTISKAGHHDPLMIHRSVFTSYALRRFLKLYKFKIVKCISSGYYPLPNNSVGNFFANLDWRHSVYMAYLVKK